MAVGIFDSGVGGLTAVRELERLVPDADYIYFGDTARLPYGTRSIFVINKYAMQDCRFLKTLSVDAILAACGTVSSNSLPLLKSAFDIPIAGVVEAAAEKAAVIAEKGNMTVAILGTGATISSGAFETAVLSFNKNIRVISRACPMFVPLVENGYTEKDNKVTNLVAMEYLEDIIPRKPSAVILACTHYPLLAEMLSVHLPESEIISSSGEAVSSLTRLLNDRGIALGQTNDKRFYVSDDPEVFCRNARMFLGRDISGNIKKIDIEAY